MNLITILILVLLVWVSLYAIYYNFLRPLVITRALFQVASVNDDLDLLVLEEKVQPKDAAVLILKHRILKAEFFIPTIDVTTILMAFSHKMTVPRSLVESERATIKEASSEVGKLSNKLDIAMLTSFAANSPFLIGVVVVLVVGAAVFSVMFQQIGSNMTALFWKAVYTKSNGSSPFRSDRATPLPC